MTKLLPFCLLFVLLLNACNDSASANDKTDIQLVEKNKIQSEASFIATLEKHLAAVSNKDAAALKSTLSLTGKMRMMLPGSEIFDSADSFMEYHTEWFSDTTTVWSFEPEILHTEIGRDLGTAITQIIYREPNRNGQPYFNRMHVSYVLEKEDGKWYVIQDIVPPLKNRQTKNNPPSKHTKMAKTKTAWDKFFFGFFILTIVAGIYLITQKDYLVGIGGTITGIFLIYLQNARK